MEIHDLIRAAIEHGASDLHLAVGIPPSIRVNGEILFLDRPVLTPEESRRLTFQLLTDAQKERFERVKELDFATGADGLGRFRVNAYRARGCVECALRMIPVQVRSLDELGVPPVAKDLAMRSSGLILIAGPAGMGKTTTMAAMVDHINEQKRCRIIIIEDPIEYLHHHKKSVVIQREVGQDPESDTHSFAAALVHALRQDPNVVCVGEMRDLDTFSIALTAAETGHLVLGTIHTQNTIHTISRIVDVFPPAQQQQIRIQLANCLGGVISQILLPKLSGDGLVLATEVMVCTPAIRRMIRENKLEQMMYALETGSELCMRTMDSCLLELYETGVIHYDVAVARAVDPNRFRQLLDKRADK